VSPASGLVVAVLAIAGTCALSTPAVAAGSSNDEVRGPTARRSWTARVVVPTAVRARPELNAPRTGRVGTIAAWNGGSVRLLVLAARTDARGRRWIKVRLPERPNARSGWMPADFARLSAVRWRFVIDLRARRARAYHDGHLKRSWPVVIGKRATPTPRGRFAVYERVRQPAGSELGPYALHLTAHSRTLFEYGGGPGRIALHGRDGTLLRDPLGSAASHGCVRMDDRVLLWLATRAAPGTPVEIR
jgi:hypothetical protein